MSKQIDFVTPVARTLTVEGVEVVVTPLRVKEVPGVVRHLDGLLAALVYEAGSMDVPRMIAMMGDHGDAIIAATAICIRQPLAWVEQLLPDRLAVLAMLAVEVNADFFTRALPGLKAALPQLVPELAKAIGAHTPQQDRPDQVNPAGPGPTPSTV